MLSVQSTALRISTIFWKFVLIITMRWKNFNQAVAYIFCRLLYVFVCKLQSQVILVFCKINNKDSKVICNFSKLTLKPMLKKFCTLWWTCFCHQYCKQINDFFYNVTSTWIWNYSRSSVFLLVSIHLYSFCKKIVCRFKIIEFGLNCV